MNRVLLAVLAACSSVAPALAAPPPPKCHVGTDYVVVTRERDGEPGSDILVKSKPAKAVPCRFVVEAKDFAVGQGENADFLAIAGRFLALDAGTGPDRRLLVFDVAARRKLVDVPYDDARKLVTNAEGFVFWQVGDKPIKPTACTAAWRKAPDNKGATSAHASAETLFAFADGSLRKTGQTGCVRTQSDM